MKLGDIDICRRVYDRGKGMTFLVAGQDHYGSGVTTLLSERLAGVRCLDAREEGPAGRPVSERTDEFGNNDYALSNLHRWLNSDREDWYEPSHERDAPPENDRLRYGRYGYRDLPGFLSGFSRAFRDALVEAGIPVLARTGRGSGVAEGRTLPVFYDPFILKAKPSEEDLARVMSPYGSVSYTYAYNDIAGVRPLVNLDSRLEVEDDGKPRAEYRIVS